MNVSTRTIVPAGAPPEIFGPRIRLRSGGYFDLAAPEPLKVQPFDIAHALGNLCRFTGHTRRFYSVAEHSYRCSFLVPPEHALCALLHDAAEAYVGDMSSPLKALLPAYREIEARVWAAVARRFALPLKLPEEVKAADLAMLAAEKKQVLGCDDAWSMLDGVKPASVVIAGWHPERAADAFLTRLQGLLREAHRRA